MAELLGRTNQAFPSIWFQPSIPADPTEISSLIGAILETGAPIDVSSQPALWGGQMRGTDRTLVCRSSLDYARATDEGHATYLLQAHLIETLSCVGREYFDFYFLRIRNAVEEFQISGALQAMELARQEGHIRFLGIACDGPALATLGQWQFHDAFDTLLVRRNPLDSSDYDTLAPIARERRVGIVTTGSLRWQHGIAFPRLLDHEPTPGLVQALLRQHSAAHPIILEVRSAGEVGEVLVVDTPPVDLDAELAPYLVAARREDTWKSFADSADPERRAAYARWRRS